MHNKALTFAKVANAGYVACQFFSPCYINYGGASYNLNLTAYLGY